MNDFNSENAIKPVIRAFTEKLLSDVESIGIYKLHSICGVGSNGVIINVSEPDALKPAALKLVNVVYLLSRIFHLDQKNLHREFYCNFSFVVEQIAKCKISIQSVHGGVPPKFLSRTEEFSFWRECSALSKLPKEDGFLYLMAHGYVKISVDSISNKTFCLPFFVVPILNGYNLSDYLSFKVLSVAESLHLGKLFLNEIGVVHECGVVHRDLHYKNLIYEESNDRLHIVDFGSAMLCGDCSYEIKGERRGARRFMSPEQFRNPSKCNFQTDYYFLGSLLFFLLSGFTPYERSRVYETRPYDLLEYFSLQVDSEKKKSNVVEFVNSLLTYDSEYRLNDIREMKLRLDELLYD